MSISKHKTFSFICNKHTFHTGIIHELTIQVLFLIKIRRKEYNHNFHLIFQSFFSYFFLHFSLIFHSQINFWTEIKFWIWVSTDIVLISFPSICNKHTFHSTFLKQLYSVSTSRREREVELWSVLKIVKVCSSIKTEKISSAKK